MHNELEAFGVPRSMQGAMAKQEAFGVPRSMQGPCNRPRPSATSEPSDDGQNRQTTCCSIKMYASRRPPSPLGEVYTGGAPPSGGVWNTRAGVADNGAFGVHVSRLSFPHPLSACPDFGGVVEPLHSRPLCGGQAGWG